jgi:NADPH-dependent curcumin reductase CurA
LLVVSGFINSYGFINNYIRVAELGAELWAESVATAEKNADDGFSPGDRSA